MKIAIDTQTMLGQKSGFGFYVENLIENLKKLAPENEYILIAPSAKKDLSTPQRFIWDQFTFPSRAKKNKVDLLHKPGFSAPVFYGGKIVVTCHDIIPVLFPKNFSFTARLFWAKWMPLSYRRADLIIVDSENTKNDLISHLRLPQEKIKVITLAASENFRPVSQGLIESSKKKYKLPNKYFTHIGTLEPRKNLLFLINAYAHAVKNGLEESLVIVGKKGWFYEEMFKLVLDLKLQEKVIFTGYVPDEDIPALYGGATALIFPSLYEGFGLPILEAMACGVPVISSNASSMPEVAGEAGILLDPANGKLWAENMVKVANSLALQNQMKEKGLKQAAKFSWEKTAQETLKVYKQLITD